MYQIILILIILAAIAWILWLTKKGRIDNKISKQVVTESYHTLRTRLRFKDRKPINNLRVIAYQLSLIFLILLVLSSYLPVILTGGHLSGLLLIFHVTIAPLFCISLAVFALFWAHTQRFSKGDNRLLRDRSFSRIFSDGQISPAWEKLIFWLFLIVALPAILSIILSMYPLFGSEGQEILLQTHRYTTLVLFILAVVHTIAVIRKHRPAGQKADKIS